MKSTDSLAAFRDALEEIGCRPEQIRKIICTHHHPDHFGAAAPLKELTGATVYVHPAEYERSHMFVGPRADPEMVRKYFLAIGMPLQQLGYVPSPHEFWASMYAPVEPDVPLEDGQLIRVGDVEIEVVWTPGHAPGHCVMYLPRPRLMIAGDHLLPKITPHVGYFHGGPENPLGDFLDSQRKVQRLEVDWVLPAHGGVFTDHRHRANQIIHHHDARLQEMLDLLRKRPRAPYDLARHAFGFDIDSSIAVQFPATFETLAHLEYLCHAGQVVRTESDGQILYHVA
jgi:glyoxylase-like metal-dependent hydrolase (beta-lactamase superfamily II)